MDSRNIRNGYVIPSENYCDQPSIVVTDDGAWLVVITTGPGEEGEHGQHIISMRSFDQGRTWSTPIDIEPSDGPEASYAVLLKSPSGRIFCFYNHNTDNMRTVKSDYPGICCSRVDSLGHYVFRYSDDNGLSWSDRRIEIPIRTMQMDRYNAYSGTVKFFWNVGKPLWMNGEAYLTLHRIGAFGAGDFRRTEGIILHSPDLMTVKDPANAKWETLPDGEIGLRSPEGAISEEQCLAQLSDGSLFCTWRTISGSPACAYSRDRGHTWTLSKFMTNSNGKRIKHPRAANFIWKRNKGGFLHWFHNQGGNGYAGRNPAWISYGEEYDAHDGKRIRWSDPEILLYDPDTTVRISYPDLLQEGGAYFFAQTQKTVARICRVDSKIIDGMASPIAPTDGMPIKDEFWASDTGFSLIMQIASGSGELLRIENEVGVHISLKIHERRLILTIDDGESVTQAWSDRMNSVLHQIAVIVDKRARIITFVIDGVLSCGENRQRGWFRLNSNIHSGRIIHKFDGFLFLRPILHWEARALMK